LGSLAPVAGWNRELQPRIAAQVEELGRVGRLNRFLGPRLAELNVSQGDENILESHRCCILRPARIHDVHRNRRAWEVLDFLRQLPWRVGPLVSQFEGKLDQFSGDGIMVYFNDPIPDPAERAVKMAMAMREAAGNLIAAWRRHGCELWAGGREARPSHLSRRSIQQVSSTGAPEKFGLNVSYITLG
jgi:adenylate cyclase